MDRERAPRRRYAKASSQWRFINPYPWMPSTDARVHLYLEQLRVPFSYRYFNAEVPMLKTLIPDFAPEFTLKDYKIVIMVMGSLFGALPSVLDRAALAKAILERAGWKVYVWWEYDIHTRLEQLFESVRELKRLHTRGAPYRNPYGTPDVMAAFRRMMARRRRIITTDVTVRSRETTGRRRGRRGGAFRLERRYFKPGASRGPARRNWR